MIRKVPWRATTIVMLLVCAGAVGALLSNGLMEMSGYVILNTATGAMGLMGVTMLCLAYSMDRSPNDESSYLFYILLILTYCGILCENFSWFADGRPELSWANRALCFGSYLVSAVIAPAFMKYQRVVFPAKEQSGRFPLVKLFMFVDIAYLTVAAISGFLFTIDENGYFQIGAGHYLSLIYPSVILIMCISENFQRKIDRRKRLPLLVFNITPLVTGAFSILYLDYSLVYVAAMFMLMLMYFTIQMERSIERAEQEKKIAEQSSDLMEKQMQIMMSQIQPHFIYNTLGSISSLCEENPLKARDVTDRFAMYLRVNMANLKRDRLIPFSDEWEHTKTYLWIEQMRFDSFLHIVSDITCTDFKLPPLSLQPLVENAVKHGITPKADGGTITISTREQPDCYVVRISDDGMGFDPQATEKDGRLHVGIENVKNRIEILCGGELRIQSKVGEGTTAELIIPKEGKE
ncbi:MAG: sensor histidine kinase [Oscillospiraceae bacterium]